MDAGDVFAGLALLLSVYATVVTVRFNARQKSLIESQESLNKRLLAREDDQVKADRQADLGASFIKIGSSQRRLKVFNKGRATARNVTIGFPEGQNCLIQSDIDSKFPLEGLEPMQSVELIASIDFQSKSKYPVTLFWADDFQESNQKTVYPTV
jgi:hypothetical protein